MELIFRRKSAAIICTALFVTAITVSALMGNIIVSHEHYVTLKPDYASLSLYHGIERLVSAATCSSLQMLVIFLAGFSMFALPASALVAVWRGISFGYTASVIAEGRISFSNGGKLSIFGLVTVPSFAVILLMYFLTSVMILFFMSASVSFAERIRSRPTDGASLTKRYVLLFFVVSGACALCDIIKSLLI